MYDLMGIIAGLSIGIGFLVIVARILENRAKAHGSLFTQPPTPRGRIGSVFLALLFGGMFLAELLFQDSYHVVFPILSLALFFYALGATKFLSNLQSETSEESKSELNEDGHW
jgi:O-antigen ligase